ncbi:SusC/RagA family TonB-linked outer membrane protein [Pseudoflavitalea sp. G-6-1-2]|uniref:SusC/RagA family TonB-linked outer membrane protein n=1 Tax=Pseudoflavitalea sp. G-6-1-2 TaxID=2728841 RepID=UPI00146E8101|nr:SusC/RagA family TonB-linked outer membrane protein [Pseudoflavitalea sp. G-6-1-2]NML23755.1 SusC/RagA family TonB-linked outer membrane protein [Pseudoflavitalea sp. G-6-1-2]
MAILGLLSATGYAQSKITLHYKNQRLDTIFNAIARQANIDFICDGRNVGAILIPRISLIGVGLEEAVQKALRGLPVTYAFIGNSIVIRLNQQSPAISVVHRSIRCTVTGAQKEPLPGASIELIKAAWVLTADGYGNFELQGVAADEMLLISAQNHLPMRVPVSMLPDTIALKPIYKPLDAVVVLSLGRHARSESVLYEPVFAGSEVFAPGDQNILQGLNGRVAGLSLQLNSGMPEASPNVDIRGGKTMDRLVSSSDPLLVIDGAPFDPGIAPLNLLFSPAGGGDNSKGMAALNCINPMDIDSVTVLKGPAATALYGSRGGNGVIEYFTKRARSDKPVFSLSILSGIRQVVHLMPMFSLQQYRNSRTEAFSNDGISITDKNAPDLNSWGNSYTDFGKRYTGHNSGLINLQLNYAGALHGIRYYLGAGMKKEGAVSGLGLGSRQFNLRVNLSRVSASGKIEWLFNNYLSGQSLNTTQYDLTRYIIMPPNYPLYDSSGRLFFTGFNRLPNPDAMAMKRYDFANSYGSSNLRVNVKLLPHLELHSTISLSKLVIREHSTNPAASNAPSTQPMGEAAFARTVMKGLFLQTYASYEIITTGFEARLMAGTSWQQRNTGTCTRYGYEYNSDEHLNNPDSAGRLDKQAPVNSRYKYGSVFSSGMFSFKKKYLLQFTGRADASSRVGPKKQLALFPSAAAGWIVSQENFFRKWVSFVNFLKLSFTAGRSGNDVIGDRRFDGSWVEDGTMEGMIIYQPQTPYNPAFGWELNKELEATLEIGLLNERLQVIASAYRNRSTNLLMRTRLSDQTGYRSMVSNVDVELENRGIELTTSYRGDRNKKLNWEISFNITLPDNRLLKLPAEVAAEYPGLFEVGRSVQAYSAYKWLGVDPDNGNGRFADEDKNGQFPSAGDLRFRGDLDPRFYGGCRTGLHYKGFSLMLDLYFRTQTGRNYLWYTGNLVAGRANNQPLEEWDRWREAGDLSGNMKFTTAGAGAIPDAKRWKSMSDAAYSDASYLRCKAVMLSYDWNMKQFKMAGIQSARIYLNAANLFTITGFKGHDPETQGLFSLPPLRQLTAGIELRL